MVSTRDHIMAAPPRFVAVVVLVAILPGVTAADPRPGPVPPEIRDRLKLDPGDSPPSFPRHCRGLNRTVRAKLTRAS